MRESPRRRTAAIFVLAIVSMIPAGTNAETPEASGREADGVVPIARVLADGNSDTILDRLGERVIVRGVATVPTGLLSRSYHLVYLQDDSAGIAYYSEEIRTEVRTGDRIEVRGEVGQYRGAPQIRDGAVRILGRGEPPGPLDLSLREAASWEHFGKLAIVRGTVTEVDSQGYVVAKLEGTEDPTAGLGLFVPALVADSLEPGTLEKGARISVSGVLTVHSYTPPHRDFQIVLRKAEDLSVIGEPLPSWLAPAAWIAALLTALGLVVYWLSRRIWHRTVRKRRRKVEVLGRLSSAIVPPPSDEEELLETTSAILREEGILDASVVHLVNPDRRVHLKASYGLPPELSETIRREGEGEPLTEEALERRRVGVPAESEELSGSIGGLEELGLQMVASLPLTGKERTLGLLTAFRRTGDPPSGEELAILSSAASILASGIESIEMARRAEEHARLLEELSITDELTGLYNRRFLDEYLRIQMAMARREGKPVAFIVIDLDHFKEVNDTFGHPEGDRILNLVGNLLGESVRASDLPVRLGGEEFLVVMPNTGKSGACAFGDRLRREIAGLEVGLSNDNGESWKLTASVGVALFPDHGEDAERVLEACDRALYSAKRAGRDQLRLSDGT
ncbi:MAG: diguanylate cyclase, partial [Thermoanaerobaculia bacterium]|nr:diguanylate cyclase [Thermoanaerobaculia bacterium]